MELQAIIISVIVIAVVASLLGGYFGARFVYEKMNRRRDESLEQARHQRDAARLRRRLENRLSGRLDNAIEAARKEEEEAKRHRIESRLLADHEVEDIAWIFQDDNLRDYYNGDVLVDTGWFDRNDVVRAITRSSSKESFDD